MQLQASLGSRQAATTPQPFLGSRLPAAPRPQQCRRRMASISCTAAPEKPQTLQRPDPTGRYGKFGGKYVPETLVAALAELEQAYAEAVADPAFQVGGRAGRRRPTCCTHAALASPRASS